MPPTSLDSITAAFKSYLEGRRSFGWTYGQINLYRHYKDPDTVQRVAGNLGYTVDSFRQLIEQERQKKRQATLGIARKFNSTYRER